MNTKLGENHLPRDENAPSRPPTPELPDRPATAIIAPYEFSILSVDEQVRYTTPVLHSVIKGTYGPSQEDHSDFIAGGFDRQKAVLSAGQDGGFSKNELETIRYEILRWALRDERRATIVKDNNDEEAVQDDLGQREIVCYSGAIISKLIFFG